MIESPSLRIISDLHLLFSFFRMRFEIDCQLLSVGSNKGHKENDAPGDRRVLFFRYLYHFNGFLPTTCVERHGNPFLSSMTNDDDSHFPAASSFHSCS